MKTGEKIRFYRHKRGFTQEQLGELCGIHGSMISAYERGERNPKIETIQKFASALGVSVGELYSDEIVGLYGRIQNLDSFIEKNERKSAMLVPKNTVEQAKVLAYIQELVALVNALQSEREYNYAYNRGKWICVWYTPIETLQEVYVVKKDTRMTDENLSAAVKAMEKELARANEMDNE